MQKASNDQVGPSSFFRRFEQISESHCGPAVVQMLLSNLGLEVDQDAIVKACGAEKTIDVHGTRLDQLRLAVRKLAPSARFWYKYEAHIDDIRLLLRVYGYPVGIEWQGIFEEGAEEEEGDFGHYSVITNVNDEKNALVVVDPYHAFTNQDRIISIPTFLRRWWDMNEVKDAHTKRRKLVKDTRLLFVIAYRDTWFPHTLRMKTDDPEMSLR